MNESPLWVTASASYCLSAVGLEIDSEVSPNAAGNAPLNLFSVSTAVFASVAWQRLVDRRAGRVALVRRKPSKTSP